MIFYNGFNLLVDIILIGVVSAVTYYVTHKKILGSKRDSFIPPF